MKEPWLRIAGSQGDFDSDILRFVYGSLTTPPTTTDHNMVSGQRYVAQADSTDNNTGWEIRRRRKPSGVMIKMAR